MKEYSTKKDVFRRLSNSPTKNKVAKLSVSSSKVQNFPITSRTSPIRNIKTHARLTSPKCLKDYQPTMLVQSVDRHHFNEGRGDLNFLTSPTKFNLEKTVGGDGSRTRIRSRFKNGLLSPERLQNEREQLSPSKHIQGSNLFTKLKREDEEWDMDKLTEINTSHNKKSEDSPTYIPLSPNKKNVKFELPITTRDQEINDSLKDIKSMLINVIKKQDEMNSRISQLEDTIRYLKG
ncbi:hypothetical protein NCAS_0B03670 [Naumovozyma castellii]|uniref:Uncharacterized protein n=1 Tax=Naumovozyma castellii TaxID=27288 RepID=G0VBX4_NAUCA|nr:hypothetical protein NCAS_0B03670 [Naumovozyma castellii CBS 4309]CCC68451.1 hypothetical protein NCAS_0B03670 [Naumovozyma castellii CBS 4309]